MSKIITLLNEFLNRINKLIWKFIIFLSKFIKIDEVNHLDDKPDDAKYRLFNVDYPAIIEPFVRIDHKLIKDNNIKPVKRRNGKTITIDVKCPFYLKNQSTLNVHDKKFYQKHPEKIKLRYVYRKFNIDLPTLHKDYRDLFNLY